MGKDIYIYIYCCGVVFFLGGGVNVNEFPLV